MTETIFEILAEGGSIAIERRKNSNGEKFIYHHNEMDFTDEGLEVNEKDEYDNFEQPFQLINSKFPWFRLHLEIAHEDYREYIISELIKILNKQDITAEQLRHSKQNLEKTLKIKLHLENLPLQNGLQNIIVENLIKFTTYEHDEHKENYNSPSNESKFVVKAKFETWLAGDQIFEHEQVKMSSEIVDSFQTIGKLEINGNTIIIKNEFGQIKHAFSSDKFFVSTTPILSNSKNWFYKSY